MKYNCDICNSYIKSNSYSDIPMTLKIEYKKECDCESTKRNYENVCPKCMKVIRDLLKYS